MAKTWLFFALCALGIFIVDQNLKSVFLSGWRHESSCISLTLAINKGVAFSMFSFLGEWLKWIQVILLASVLAFVVRGGHFNRYAFPLGLLYGAALGNIVDRFLHGGVVDYVYWHCGFDFAIFNFADVTIDIAVAILLYLNIFKKY